MDNHIFRSAIGGFHRQDVMEYIERTQKQSEENTAWLESQVEQLQKSEEEARSALQACQQERDQLAAELKEMTSKYNNAKNNWESQAQAKESSRRDVVQRDQTIRDMTEENQHLFHRVQELEGNMETLRRQKEQLAQLELDAHHRADVVVEQAQERAKAITEAAEANARAVTDQAKTQAQTILTDAESAAQAVLKKAKLSIEDTAEDFKEVLESFQTVSGRVAEGLKLLERTMGEFPVGLNALREDLDGLYGQITAREAEALGLSAGGNQDE
ncbi:MAG: hypothetical protein HFF73_07585 [Oscillospiraceae bacterium]|nr:hypothetical protein [Oscillospiraceae bacterium]